MSEINPELSTNPAETVKSHVLYGTPPLGAEFLSSIEELLSGGRHPLRCVLSDLTQEECFQSEHEKNKDAVIGRFQKLSLFSMSLENREDDHGPGIFGSCLQSMQTGLKGRLHPGMNRPVQDS